MRRVPGESPGVLAGAALSAGDARGGVRAGGGPVVAVVAFGNAKKNSRQSLLFGVMARPERFELPTAWFVARYSIQLSYGRVLPLLF